MTNWETVARILAGQLSTREGFTDMHPENVLKQAIEIAEEAPDAMS